MARTGGSFKKERGYMRGGGEESIDIDNIIDRLLEVRGCRPGKQVNLRDWEIR